MTRRWLAALAAAVYPVPSGGCSSRARGAAVAKPQVEGRA